MPATQPINHVLATREALTRLVDDLLSTLDRDPARFLADQGVRGQVCDSWRCPLAEWLTGELEEQLGGHVHVVVWSARVAVVFGKIQAVVELPGPVAQFVRDFDEGLHANLIG